MVVEVVVVVCIECLIWFVVGLFGVLKVGVFVVLFDFV